MGRRCKKAAGKASEFEESAKLIMRIEAYFDVRLNDEGRSFSAASGLFS
jgi:hypothetical protein